MSGSLTVLTTAANEAEADLIREHLLAEGVHAIAERTLGSVQWGQSGARNVFVEEADLARAREILGLDSPPFSEEELTRLSEEAGREAAEE
jgi:hypothetical protein